MTQTAKHTEWEYHRGLDYAVVMLPGESTDAASISINAVDGNEDDCDKLGNLIVAAPKLLAALKALQRLTGTHLSDVRGINAGHQTRGCKIGQRSHCRGGRRCKMKARDYSKEQFEKRLAEHGMTLKWFEPPAEWHCIEAAHVRLHGTPMPHVAYMLKKGGNFRRRNYAALIVAESEKCIERRKEATAQAAAGLMLEALKSYVDECHADDKNFERKEPQSLKEARAAITAATYDPERHLAQYEAERAARQAEVQKPNPKQGA